MRKFLFVFLLISQTIFAEEKVTFSFVGDIMLSDLPGKYIKDGKDPFQYVDPLLAPNDFRIGNFEFVVGKSGVKEDKPWTFLAHPRTLGIYKKHFNVASLSNNHSGDYGSETFSKMLGLMQKNNILYFGGGHNQREAHTPLILEKNGIKIALLGYNNFFPRSFEHL